MHKCDLFERCFFVSFFTLLSDINDSCKWGREKNELEEDTIFVQKTWMNEEASEKKLKQIQIYRIRSGKSSQLLYAAGFSKNLIN